MDSWLIPSVIATLCAIVMMSVIYTYLYKKEKEIALRYFCRAWGFYTFRLISVLLLIYNPELLFLKSFISIGTIFNSIWLFIGVVFLSGASLKNKSINVISILPIIGILFFLLSDNDNIENIIVFSTSGLLYILTGFIFIRKIKKGEFLSKVIGVNYILWGIHKFDYPFLYDVKVFAPYGYLLAAIFALFAAISIIVLFYELQKKAYLLNEQRLHSLMEITDTQDVKILLDKVLHVAINITESEYGYIYRYNEKTEQFILNTWSKDVHEDCKVMNRQTTYDLNKTGCWGEAIRQRKPFVLNDYSKLNQYVKGTPQGHVAIKKFLSIPVFSKEKIVATIGVANKKSDYDEGDIRQLTLLMRATWKIVEQRDYESELREAKEKAEESDRLKNAFLSNISHEVRTPLNGILGFSELLRSNQFTKEQRFDFIEMIGKSGKRLLKTVEDIINISIIQTDQISLNISQFNLYNLINEIINTCSSLAEQKGIELEYDCDAQIELFSDEEKMEIIITKLIENAIKFTHKGKIIISCTNKEKHLSVCIQDTGIGIAEYKRNDIFKKFKQGEYDYTRKYEGLGLGLSIAKAYVEALDGEIVIESLSNQKTSGTKVTFTLPA